MTILIGNISAIFLPITISSVILIGNRKRVELGDALPGDIIKFSGCVFEKTFSDGSIVMSKASSHVGIVYSVDSDTTKTIADQNNGGNGDGKKNRGDVAYEDSQKTKSI